jgi:serine protease AprX
VESSKDNNIKRKQTNEKTNYSNIQYEDPFNIINRAQFKKGKIVESSTSEIPWHAFSRRSFEKKESIDAIRRRPRTKLHPLLKKWIRSRPGKDTEQLIINFRDDLIMPRFPELDINEKRDSDKNKKLLAEAEHLVNEIKERRNETHRKWIEDYGKRHRVRFIESFWLTNAILVEMPLESVSEMVKYDEIVYVEPRYGGEKPPQNANPNDDVDDGRARMNSDPYFNIGLTSGYIGLLDTGIRNTHTLFNTPSNIAFRIDCTGGNNPDDDCWSHGTCSAAIISGNGTLGNAFRGVTGVTLDCFKVYPANCGGLDASAVVKGFEKAVTYLDRVIVAEMQANGDQLSSISKAADNAFDAGAVIIAANGNNGDAPKTVNAPAIAHRVIGVGCFDVQTQNQMNYQSRGPAPDGRYKPDVQTPTNTETAKSNSNTALGNFGGTSGSTPYAGGAAALLRNWLKGNNYSIDPGQVYAQIILSGQNAFPFNNTSGAGPIRLPTDGVAWWGKVSVGNKMTIDIPLNIGGKHNTFDAALWWPEAVFDFIGMTFDVHNDVDLHLIDPKGVTRDSSISIPSVFERARVSGNIDKGTWKLRIRGYKVNGSQTVYWAAAAHTRPL